MTESTNTVKPEFPRPVINDDVAFLYEGFALQELRIQRCTSCGRLRHPPGPQCPHCHSFEWATVCASGEGTVHSFTVHHHPPIPPFETPHAVVLVDLDEGVRFVAGFRGDSSELAIADRVSVEFVELASDYQLPVFVKLDTVGASE